VLGTTDIVINNTGMPMPFRCVSNQYDCF
jgi:hypothetical protein